MLLRTNAFCTLLQFLKLPNTLDGELFRCSSLAKFFDCLKFPQIRRSPRVHLHRSGKSRFSERSANSSYDPTLGRNDRVYSDFVHSVVKSGSFIIIRTTPRVNLTFFCVYKNNLSLNPVLDARRSNQHVTVPPKFPMAMPFRVLNLWLESQMRAKRPRLTLLLVMIIMFFAAWACLVGSSLVLFETSSHLALLTRLGRSPKGFVTLRSESCFRRRSARRRPASQMWRSPAEFATDH